MPTRFSFSRSKRLISVTSANNFLGSCSTAARSQSSIQPALSFMPLGLELFRVGQCGR